MLPVLIPLERKETVVFLLNKNLVVKVKIVKCEYKEYPYFANQGLGMSKRFEGKGMECTEKTIERLREGYMRAIRRKRFLLKEGKGKERKVQ